MLEIFTYILYKWRKVIYKFNTRSFIKELAKSVKPILEIFRYISNSFDNFIKFNKKNMSQN